MRKLVSFFGINGTHLFLSIPEYMRNTKRFVTQMHLHHNTTACPFQWFITHSHMTQHFQTHSPSPLYRTQTWLTLIRSLYHCFINSSHMLGGNGPCRGSGVRLCPREMVSRAVGPAEALTAPEMTWLSSTGAVCAVLG